MGKVRVRVKTLKNLYHGIATSISYSFGVVLNPRWLWIALTDRCNSRCEICSIWKNKYHVDLLTSLELRNILSNPLFSDVRQILNAGGEPTLRRDLTDVLVAEHKALPKAAIQLSTNGLLPKKIIEVAGEMRRLNVDFSVGIPLEGLGPEHDRIRGVPGNFEKTASLIKSLRLMNVKVGLGAVLTEKNLEANIHAKNFADQIGIPLAFQYFDRSDFYGNKDMENDCLNTEEAVRMMPDTLYRKMWLDKLRHVQPRFKCFALNTFAMLKCNGDLVPCLSFWNNVVGNIKLENPTSVWNSPQAKSVRRMVRQCGGCLNSCGAGWSLGSLYYPNLIYRLKRR
jgi:MoaA/NifB/PqqE/SkfB family radical SAM enzyme